MAIEFKPLNEEDIAQKIDLELIAQVDGINGLFGAEESKLTNEVKRFHDLEIERNAPHFRSLEKTFLDSDDLLRQNGYKSLIKDLRFKWKTKKTEIEDKLFRAKEELLGAEREIKNFRLIHQITREPHINSSKWKFALFLVLITMAVIEIYTNSALLSEAVGGLQTAMSIAFVFATINIGLSWLVGKLVFTSFIHIKKLRRHLCYGIAFLYSLTIIYFNFAIGVFRGISDQIGIMADDAELKLMVTAAVFPFDNLTDLSFQSVALIGMGILFAIIAVVEGYFFDEPYPGYARYGHKLNEKKTQLEKLKAHAVNLLRESHTKSAQDLNEIRARRWQANITWGDSVDLLQAAFNSYKNWISQLEKIAKNLVSRYRNTLLRFTDNQTLNLINVDQVAVSLGFIPSPKDRYPSISDELVSDPEKKKQLQDNCLLIEDEHDAAVDTMDQFFNSELTNLENYIRSTQ